MRTDPRALDRYTKTDTPRRVKITPEKARNLDLLTRALQNIPPREMMMLYQTVALRVEQEEICSLYRVRQSNVSYRIERAHYRIELFVRLISQMSETSLRRALIQTKFSPAAIQTILGVVKTTSQSATAEALGASQGSVRHIFTTALSKLASLEGYSEALGVLRTVETNFNQLRAIRTQRRWQHKVGGSNYPTPVGETR